MMIDRGRDSASSSTSPNRVGQSCGRGTAPDVGGIRDSMRFGDRRLVPASGLGYQRTHLRVRHSPWVGCVIFAGASLRDVPLDDEA
jgi:hypothetical protein